jgi:hypothetical protein
MVGDFDDLISPKPIRWPKKGDLPLQRAKRTDAAGPLVHDRMTRTVSIMAGFMRAGTALADEAIKEQILRYDLV